jgi:hypothetical protein
VSDRVGIRLAELRNEYRTGEEQLRRPAAEPARPAPDGAAVLSVG